MGQKGQLNPVDRQGGEAMEEALRAVADCGGIKTITLSVGPTALSPFNSSDDLSMIFKEIFEKGSGFSSLLKNFQSLQCLERDGGKSICQAVR